MDETYFQTHTMREDIATIKERVCANEKSQRERMDALSLQITKIDDKLDTLSEKVQRLETQNRTLKWIIGLLVSGAAVAVTWMRGAA